MDQEAVGLYIDAVSQAIDLPIPAEYRQGVIDNMTLILRQAEGLMALQLESTEEAAPVFHP